MDVLFFSLEGENSLPPPMREARFQSEVGQGSRESPSSSQAPYPSGLPAAKPSVVSLLVLSPLKPLRWVSVGLPYVRGMPGSEFEPRSPLQLRKSLKAMKKP